MEKDNIIGGKWNILGKSYDGDLIFNKSNGGIVLSIYYKDQNHFLAWDNQPLYINEITGTLNQKIKCILTDCKVVKRHTQAFVKHHIIIVAKSIFFGISKRKKQNIKFNEMHFKMSNIFAWTKLNGFKELFDNKDYWLNIVYESKDRVSVKIDDNTTIEFVPTMGAFNPNMLVENVNLNQFVSIYIKKDIPTIYDNFFDDLNKVINLITLATNKRININKIECIDYSKFYMLENTKDYIKYEMMSHKIKLDDNIEEDSKIQIIDYLFDLPEMIIDNKIQVWFNTYDKYRNIYNLYLLGIKNDIPLEIRFCNLMQAIELLHSIKFSRKKKFIKHIEKKFIANPEIIDDIENNIDQKESSFIILRSRLIDIFTNDFELTKSVNMYINVIPFANILSDSRNYYTHYNDAKRNKCVVKDNLKYSVAILEYSVSSYILKELGFSLDYINKKQKYTLDYIISERMIEKILENKR
ncbi:MAG: hypothetical protein Q4E39_05110 [bacterium]|nr:hypothetical protein [bacterium]